MPAPFFPTSRTVVVANALQTELALSVVKLFKSGFVPDAATVVADLDDNEADYSDYAPQTITAWLEPGAAIGGGVQITAPTVQFLCTGSQAVGNTIGGYWIELAGGSVVLIRQFDEPVSMSADLQHIEITPTIVVPTGA
jgi:hypothetical protein